MSTCEQVLLRSRTVAAEPADVEARRAAGFERFSMTSNWSTRRRDAAAQAAIDRWNNEGGRVYDDEAETSPTARRATVLRVVGGGAA